MNKWKILLFIFFMVVSFKSIFGACDSMVGCESCHLEGNSGGFGIRVCTACHKHYKLENRKCINNYNQCECGEGDTIDFNEEGNNYSCTVPKGSPIPVNKSCSCNSDRGVPRMGDTELITYDSNGKPTTTDEAFRTTVYCDPNS